MQNAVKSLAPQRSALYVPANNRRAIDKVESIDADWIIFDLEDSVAPESKATARQALVNAYKTATFGRSQTAIRCNQVHSADFELDLATVVECCPQAVLLPKISAVSDIDKFALDATSAGLDSTVSSWFMIETARGIAQLESIVRRGAEIPWPLQTLVVGHNDIASETRVSLDHERRYLIPWLMSIVLQAKQADLQVLDSVWNTFRDLDGFKAEALQALQMGFDGKTLIHPSQVEPANKIFAPSAQQLEHAQLLVDTFAQPANENKNVLNINGEMFERLHLLQAQQLLDKYNSIKS